MDASAQSSPVKPISRREFLYYLLMGSMTLAGVGGGAALYRYASKRTSNGIPENVLEIDDITGLLTLPLVFPLAETTLTYADGRLYTFHSRCPFLGAMFKWVDLNNRFECPRCGSKFRLNGELLAGPSSRNLDRFRVKVFTADGTVDSNDNADPIPIDLNTIEKPWIDTGRIIPGAPHQL
jgi:Rieske Fe-S protein